MSRRCKKGMSLVELVVACALLSLATTVLASSFAFFTRSGLRYNQRQELLTFGERALLRVTDQVSLTNSTAMNTTSGSTVGLPSTVQIVYFPSPLGLTDQTIQFDASSGKLSWRSWVAYEWVPATTQLIEGRQSCTSTAALSGLAYPLSNLGSWQTRILCSQVAAFSLTGPLNNAFTVSMSLKDPLGYQVQLASSVVAQN